MSEHTPGPWEYSDRTYLVDGKMYKTGDWAIMGGSYCLAQVAKETDARLIAAAPDMADEIERLKAERDELLAACKMLHKALLYCGSADVQLRLEQEALAKYDIVVYEPRFTK